MSHTNSIFRDLKLLNIVNLNKYQQCLFMYKYLSGMLPPSMLGTFILDCNLHNYNKHVHLLIYIFIYSAIELLHSNTPLNSLAQVSGITYRCHLEILPH